MKRSTVYTIHHSCQVEISFLSVSEGGPSFLSENTIPLEYLSSVASYESNLFHDIHSSLRSR